MKYVPVSMKAKLHGRLSDVPRQSCTGGCKHTICMRRFLPLAHAALNRHRASRLHARVSRAHTATATPSNLPCGLRGHLRGHLRVRCGRCQPSRRAETRRRRCNRRPQQPRLRQQPRRHHRRHHIRHVQPAAAAPPSSYRSRHAVRRDSTHYHLVPLDSLSTVSSGACAC